MAVTLDFPKAIEDLNRDGYFIFGNPVDADALSVIGTVRGKTLHLECHERRMTTYAETQWPLSENDLVASVGSLVEILETAYGDTRTVSTA